MDHAEAVAKKIIEALRPGCVMRYRELQSNGEHDFDLLCGDLLTAAVEVTMATNSSVRTMQARIANPNSGGPFIKPVLCKKGWLIIPVEGADIRNIRKNADKYLAEIERAGKERFFAYSDAAECYAISSIYSDLGIESGHVVNWKPPANRIAISSLADGGKVETRVLADAIRREAEKDDNRTKLGNVSSHIEKHLFVYIDTINYLPWKILIEHSSERLVANLPKEITHVWAATETESANEFSVWTAKNGSPWETTRIAI